MKLQKTLAARIAGRSRKKISLDPARLEDIKEAITRADVKALMKDNAIFVSKSKGISRGRAKQVQAQKQKGRKRGQGSRKGKAGARLDLKKRWMRRIRLQRKLLKSMRDTGKIAGDVFKDLYRKSKGGFFRSKRHVLLYITEHKLMK